MILESIQYRNQQVEDADDLDHWHKLQDQHESTPGKPDRKSEKFIKFRHTRRQTLSYVRSVKTFVEDYQHLNPLILARILLSVIVRVKDRFFKVKHLPIMKSSRPLQFYNLSCFTINSLILIIFYHFLK